MDGQTEILFVRLNLQSMLSKILTLASNIAHLPNKFLYLTTDIIGG